MTEKVKITQVQANKIEELRKDMFRDDAIVHNTAVYQYDRGVGIDSLSVDMNLDDLIRALYVGYEVVPTYRVGERVHVSWSSGRTGVYKVLETGVMSKSGESDGIEIDWKGNPRPPLEIVRHATDREVEEEESRERWTSIGRSVGELKDGDVGVSRSGIMFGNIDTIKELYESEDLVGIYPAESFVSLGGED